MDQRYETFTAHITTIYRCIQKIKNVEMATFGLKGKQVQCLFNLYNSDGLSLTTLCEMCGEDKGMMSRTVKELIESELVFIDESGDRKYRNPIKLTKKGADAAKLVSDKIAEMLDHGGDGIDEDDRIVFYATLARISDNLTKICENYEI